MKQQNYSNHVRLVPVFHFLLVPLSLITLISAVIHLFVADKNGASLFASLLPASLALMAVMTLYIAREFACKAQDRAIRAEQNLRHYVLKGKLLDPRLTMSQIIALRFAPDEEFLALCEKAANDSSTSDSIKRSIITWKADHDRV